MLNSRSSGPPPERCTPSAWGAPEVALKPVTFASLMILLAATGATAAGLNLAWNNCYPSPGAALDQSLKSSYR